MNVQLVPTMSAGQFFDWYETQDRKFELVGGTPRMLPYVKRAHTTVAMNLSGILWQSLDNRQYLVGCSDFAVETPNDNIRFPDIVVFSSDVPENALRTSDPNLIVEILSDAPSISISARRSRNISRSKACRHTLSLSRTSPSSGSGRAVRTARGPTIR